MVFPEPAQEKMASWANIIWRKGELLNIRLKKENEEEEKLNGYGAETTIVSVKLATVTSLIGVEDV